MTEQAFLEAIVPDTLNLMVPVEVSGDALAVSLANSNNSYAQLLALVGDLDSEVADWTFTRMIARHFNTVLLEFATEEDDSELLDALKTVLGAIPKD